MFVVAAVAACRLTRFRFYRLRCDYKENVYYFGFFFKSRMRFVICQMDEAFPSKIKLYISQYIPARAGPEDASSGLLLILWSTKK